MTSNYYKILELNENATISEIKKAYRSMAKKLHPDVNHSPNAEENFIRVNEAYEYLIQKKLNKSIFKSNNSTQNNFDKEEWIKKERQKARKRAAYYSQKKYAKFKQSKTYKSSLIFYTIIEIIFIIIFILIIVIPIIYTINKSFDPEHIAMEITALITVAFLGSIMLYITLKNSNLF